MNVSTLTAKDHPELTTRYRQILLFYIYFVITAGISLRIYHYFYNRSLWGDEAFLGINFLVKDFYELTQPLINDQQAPLGFLWSEKFFTILFGAGNEYALRFFPLLCGIGSIPLFYHLCKSYLSDTGTAIAITCFAFASPLVAHSVEAKQYSTELLVTVVLLLLFKWFEKRNSLSASVLSGAAGSILLWFSYPSIFILFSYATLTSIKYFIRKDWKMLGLRLITFGIWGTSFLINYLTFVKRGTSTDWLVEWWREYFMPLSAATIPWLVKALFRLFDDPLGLNWLYTPLQGFFRQSFIGVFLLLLGIMFFYKKSKETFLLLVMPFILCLLASALQLYPFLWQTSDVSCSYYIIGSWQRIRIPFSIFQKG